ncbi:MAG: T9SS type A sorting domain-containing protein [Ignavibacteria bacterium]|nr:T9SS type A sorting domain-containing protein [Ignavibacteria bacterium]
MKQFFSLLFLFVFVSGFAFAQEITMSIQSEHTPNQIEGVADVLYDQTVGTNTNAYSSQDFGVANDIYDAQIADDFTATGDWTITDVVVNGSYSLSGPADGFNIFFYSDAAGIPGTEVYSEMSAPYVFDGVSLFTITMVTPAVLPAGDYWVSVQCRMDFSPGGQWYFQQVNGAFGNVAQFQNPLDGFGSGCLTWASIQTCIAAIGTDQSFALLGTAGGGGSGFPELLYYIFDENAGTTTANFASPGAGNNPADLTGTTTWATPGQFGSAIIGDAATNGGVVTGYNWDRGAGDWTISMWLEIPTDPSGSAFYLFGDGGSTSFRCFHNGIALPDNLVLRGGGLTDCIVTGIGPAPTVVTFVYNSAVPEIVAYKNGVLFSNFPQTALNMPVGTGFKVGGYGGSATMKGKMDEFRLYDRALDAAEVADTWNISIVPVELTSFTASVSENNVKLLWETASEINNSGFNVERKSANSDYSTVGFVPGFGTTTEPKSYAFSDNNLRTGVYTYRLKQIDFDGTFEYSSEAQVEVVAPAEFSLDQNYPNPFNPSTKITFSLAVNSKVSLKVFDVLGQEVASLVNQDLTAGVHNYDFNAIDFNSGVYFYRIEANGIDGTNFTNVKKMILLK